jgi:hypothetical protein
MALAFSGLRPDWQIRRIELSSLLGEHGRRVKCEADTRRAGLHPLYIF